MENVQIIIPMSLLALVITGIVVSIFIVATIQKIKGTTFYKESWHIWILNFVFSFVLGITMSIYFYGYSILDGVWVGFISLLGAPAIFEALKKLNPQTLTLTKKEEQAIIEEEKRRRIRRIR